MGDIASLLIELKRVNMEVMKLGLDLKSLKLEKKRLEGEIEKFLEQDGQTGVRYKDVTVLVQEKKSRKSKKAKEKRDDALRTLSELGINEPDAALDKILNSMRGEQYVRKVLKLQDHNNHRKKF